MFCWAITAARLSVMSGIHWRSIRCVGQVGAKSEVSTTHIFGRIRPHRSRISPNIGATCTLWRQLTRRSRIFEIRNRPGYLAMTACMERPHMGQRHWSDTNAAANVLATGCRKSPTASPATAAVAKRLRTKCRGAAEGPMCAEVYQILANVDQHWSKSAKCWAGWTKVGPMFADFDLCSAKLDLASLRRASGDARRRPASPGLGRVRCPGWSG